MIKEIYGKKIGMTQLFNEEGDLIPITLVEAPPVCVLEKQEYPAKTVARIGCFKIPESKIGKVKKPVLGYFNKLGISPYKLIREVTIEKDADFSLIMGPEKKSSEKQADSKDILSDTKQPSESEELAKGELSKEESETKNSQDENENIIPNSREMGIEIFNEGELVDVRAKTKGKGFAGVMKRHGWHGQPASHGHTMHRRPGSIGASATPSRVARGFKMPGHMGNTFQTMKNLKILKIDKDKNILFIQGSIPGCRGALIRIKKNH